VTGPEAKECVLPPESLALEITLRDPQAAG
jgi:hypothetical protein